MKDFRRLLRCARNDSVMMGAVVPPKAGRKTPLRVCHGDSDFSSEEAIS